METISRFLLTFLVNSLWQVPVAAGVAWLACRCMRRLPASHRHAVWVAALAVSVLLPLASTRNVPPAPGPQFAASLTDGSAPDSVAKEASQPTSTPAPAPVSRTVSFAAPTATVLLGLYLLFVLYRLGRLGWAFVRTVQIRRSARYTDIPDIFGKLRARCKDVFGLSTVELLVSRQVTGPVTAGRAIILPEALLAEQSVDVITTAIGHEMAHIARRDFACNLFYEVLQVPIAFHPAVWLIHREIERTREMACDEMVTQRLMEAGVYARSILSIARGMMTLPRPGYTLGVFDGDILEERIRRLVERPAARMKRARLLLATGLSALAVCAVIASSVALTARAQGGAQAILKQAEAAYNRGVYQQSVELFENAVRVDPSSVKAKLLLANAILRADITQAPRARQQYVDALGLEAGNKQALQGLMLIDTNAKQFASAREWALKAIQADATDKAAYYTIGFIDWSLTYPDYASARLAAGMKPQDSGIIPNADLRQKVRTEHGAQIEDGFRVLQIAIQLDPNYSDAMAYMNLLYRIAAGIADTPAQSADAVAKADSWVTQALDAKRRMAQNRRAPGGGPLDVDAAAPVPFVAPPPPPPPPPPPGGSQVRVEAPGAIRIAPGAAQPVLVRQVNPVYPEAARQAGVSGVVRLDIVINKEGKVRDIQVTNSPGRALAFAAMEAVRKWVYKPTLLNGEPVEVVTTVEVNFSPN
jgi:TonB family protein